jgi:hypothetical protein
MGKSTICTILFLSLFACNKDKKKGQITTKDIAGSWQLVCRFEDLDSNGLTASDKKQYANPSDSITWNFEPNNSINYLVKGQTVQSGYWYLALPQNKNAKHGIYLHEDPDYDEYVYYIGSYDENHLVIYCKTFKIVFSRPKFYWKGWELKR